MNKKKKTIDFDNISELKINENITEKVNVINGIPTYNSLKAQMWETAYGFIV